MVKVEITQRHYKNDRLHSDNLQTYIVLVGNIDLHNQTLVVQLQKYPNTFLLVFFVSPQIIQNGVALTLFFQHLPRIETRLNTNIPMHMSSVGLYKEQASLASR